MSKGPSWLADLNACIAQKNLTKLKKLRNAPQNLLAVPRLAPVQVASAKKCMDRKVIGKKNIWQC